MFSDNRRSWLKPEIALVLLRFIVCGMIAAHGWSRLLTGGVRPFAEWLEGQGLPFGLLIAASITVIEIIGTPVMAFKRLVLPLCLIYSLIYSVGIFMVHAPEGWFVVGHGRNGMEFSVLLIGCLLCVGLTTTSRRQAKNAYS